MGYVVVPVVVDRVGGGGRWQMTRDGGGSGGNVVGSGGSYGRWGMWRRHWWYVVQVVVAVVVNCVCGGGSGGGGGGGGGGGKLCCMWWQQCWCVCVGSRGGDGGGGSGVGDCHDDDHRDVDHVAIEAAVVGLLPVTATTRLLVATVLKRTKQTLLLCNCHDRPLCTRAYCLFSTTMFASHATSRYDADTHSLFQLDVVGTRRQSPQRR